VADFDGDGGADLLVYNSVTGDAYAGLLSGLKVSSYPMSIRLRALGAEGLSLGRSNRTVAPFLVPRHIKHEALHANQELGLL